MIDVKYTQEGINLDEYRLDKDMDSWIKDGTQGVYIVSDARKDNGRTKILKIGKFGTINSVRRFHNYIKEYTPEHARLHYLQTFPPHKSYDQNKAVSAVAEEKLRNLLLEHIGDGITKYKPSDGINTRDYFKVTGSGQRQVSSIMKKLDKIHFKQKAIKRPRESFRLGSAYTSSYRSGVVDMLQYLTDNNYLSDLNEDRFFRAEHVKDHFKDVLKERIETKSWTKKLG